MKRSEKLLLREVTHEDRKGRLWIVLIPELASDRDASMGIPVGPPSLDSLGLPDELATRLHNQLYHRHLITAADLRGRRNDVTAALFAACKVDTQKIVDLYNSDTKEVG